MTLNTELHPNLEDDGYEEMPPPDPEHASIHASLDPSDPPDGRPMVRDH
jgi:hypothetical protein